MLIRKATKYETSQLLQWSVSLTEELSMGYMANNELMTYDMVSNVLSKGGFYLVAYSQQEIMGWILLGVDQNFYKNETIGFIYELYVFPKYRKRGIGKNLMLHGLSSLRSNGMKKVQLNVFSSNPARKMYEKLGFREVTSLMEFDL